MTLRVTAVCGAGVLGGAELWLTSLLAATDRLSVDAIVLGDGPLTEQLSRHCDSVRLVRTGRSPASILAAVAVLTRRLRADRPDIVLANGIKAAAVAAPAARLAGVRCLWVKHDHSFDGRPVSALVRSLVDGAVVASPTLAPWSGVADPIVIPPPRPRPPLPRAAARAVLAAAGVPLDEDELLLAAVGRIVRYKGVEDAVRALALDGGQRWRLLVIGAPDPTEPGETDRLTRLAREAGVGDRVTFTGPLPEAARLLAGVDAVAVLTKDVGRGPDREGFGTVALEAMLAGAPVVTTDTGVILERLGGVAGLGVPPGDPAAVAAALGHLGDAATRAVMGLAGIERTADHPTAARCAEDLARELARVAGRPGAGRDGGPPVSVVVTVLNESDGVDKLLGRLVGQLAQPDDEIIIVDGGSRDDTAARVGAWSARDARVRLLVEPGAGISAGRNTGVRAARNGFVACTDAGCDPVPGWLAAWRVAAADRGIDQLFTGVYRVTAHGPLQRAMAVVGYPEPDELRHPTVLSRTYGRLLGRTFDPTLPTGRSMAFGVSAWQKAGGFPEDLQTGEDVLFGRTAVAAGVAATMVADAEVAWAQRPSVGQTARMYYRYGQGSGRSRDPRLLGRDLARLASYAVAPVVLVRGGRAGRALVVAAGAAYLSLPLWRVLSRRARNRDSGAGPGGAPGGGVPVIRAAALVPAAAALRDLAKAAGALRGLVDERRG